LILEDAGFDVCADARDGVEAVELAREHRPDLILMDLICRARWCRGDGRILDERAVPIVALTGDRAGDS
jgi:CheY-like chemotaxis protein